MIKRLADLTDSQKVQLVQNRWESSATLWDKVLEVTQKNTRFYDNEPEWLDNLPRKKSKVRSNRIFTDTEAVINALIANPPKMQFVGSRTTPESKDLATKEERYFKKKYDDLNVKEVLRKGLRDLYFSRLIVLKPFWNSKTNEIDVRRVDPKNIRVSKKANKEIESEFIIEEVEDNVMAVLNRFPKMKDKILSKAGVDELTAFTENPEIKYKEAWIKERVIFTYQGELLGDIRNPYWDWDGLLVTTEEQKQLEELGIPDRRATLTGIRQAQDTRTAAMTASKQVADNPEFVVDDQVDLTLADNLQAYLFNHFDVPRKPYIFATAFNNDNSPIGRTDMITQAAPLQESVDRRKRQIDDNAEVINGIVKVDASVMDKADAQKLRFETGGVIWGKGVAAGVSRETGNGLPDFVFKDMQDSRDEIDNIMAASSAFRGERQGVETKGGRLALIDQSYLRLNELVQVTDFVCYELFNWFFQLAKTRYTETHYAKDMGPEGAVEVLNLIQDDFEDGTEVNVIPGKMLPTDRQFEFDRAQKDFAQKALSLPDYLEQAGYDDPKQLAQNKFMYDVDPVTFLGIDKSKLPPPPPPAAPPGGGPAPTDQPQLTQ